MKGRKMSTDYGFCCECGAFWMADNITLRRAEDFLVDIHALAKLSRAINSLTHVDAYISLGLGGLTYIGELLEFAELHYNHKINIINEYLWFDLINAKV